jgi:hypothetical protein
MLMQINILNHDFEVVILLDKVTYGTPDLACLMR